MKKHILLVDDDKDELIIFMDALRKVPSNDGFKCTYAGSTAQAIEMLNCLVPDYIFSDFNIPRMNGLEFLQYIRDQQRFSHTQLCLYSTHISEEVKGKAANLGINYAQKTGTIESLVRNISGLLAAKPQPDYLSDFFDP